MTMESLSEFLAMGGYAGFIWPAYLIMAAVLAGLMVASRRSLKSAEAALLALEAPEEGS
ncbi:MAG: heme exporter protein CcmD [Proteobacteria bacterium]|nr:heme exporter protein CcmD [Pseudomonadota bacterium]